MARLELSWGKLAGRKGISGRRNRRGSQGSRRASGRQGSRYNLEKFTLETIRRVRSRKLGGGRLEMGMSDRGLKMNCGFSVNSLQRVKELQGGKAAPSNPGLPSPGMA